MDDPNDVYQDKWWEEAQCADNPHPEQFEMHGRESHRTPRIRMLIAQYCGRCSVALECLEEAVEMGDRSTLRGGLSPGQRKNIYKFERK